MYVLLIGWSLENQYRDHLALEDVENTKVNFTTFLNEFDSEVCPVGGVVSYSDGHVDCSVHSDDDEIEGDSADDGGVPFL
jgi:hypothetical protein